MNQGPRWGLIDEKNRGRKSRATVPLNIEEFHNVFGWAQSTILLFFFGIIS
jgi:hypothetical protein